MHCLRTMPCAIAGNIKHAGNDVISGERFILVGFYNADGRDRAGEEVRAHALIPARLPGFLSTMTAPPLALRAPLHGDPCACVLLRSQCYFNKAALEEQRQRILHSPPGERTRPSQSRV